MTTRRMNASAPTRPVIWLGETRVSVAAVVIAPPTVHVFSASVKSDGPKSARWACTCPAGAQHFAQVVAASWWRATGRCCPWDSRVLRAFCLSLIHIDAADDL